MILRYLAGVTAPVIFKAASDAVLSPDSFTAVFLQYGVVGAIALGGMWFAYRSNKRTEARADRLEEQLSALHQETRKDIIPALIASTETNAEVAQVLRDFMRDRRAR